MAIQLIINREWGLAKNENPNQGSFIIEELTDLVEEAVLKEFEAISERGGVLGAMETGYQRGKIQEESLHYEHMKHDGSYPIIGVNTFRNPHADPVPQKLELARSTEEEKRSQLSRLAEFHARNAARGARSSGEAQEDGDRQRQRLCRADEHRARLLARSDHQRAVRGRRTVPEKHVAGGGAGGRPQAVWNAGIDASPLLRTPSSSDCRRRDSSSTAAPAVVTTLMAPAAVSRSVAFCMSPCASHSPTTIGTSAKRPRSFLHR